MLIAPDRRQIDIIPFGAIEKAERVSVKGTGMTTLYVDGMKEVFEEGVPEVTFEEKSPSPAPVITAEKPLKLRCPFPDSAALTTKSISPT